jgi:flagellar basal-body rod protein FlgB
MNESIEAITTQAMSLALDAASQRQQVLALNIANANTTGYLAQRLTFETHLEAAARDIQSQGSIGPHALQAMSLRLDPVVDARGQPQQVQLDTEMAEMARNAVHYQALVKGLNRHFSILTIAVNDGRK